MPTLAHIHIFFPYATMSTTEFPKGSYSPSHFRIDRSKVLLGVAVTFIALEVLVFGLRLLARKLQGTRFEWDDALVFPALVSNLGLCIECICKSFLTTEGGSRV